MRPFEFGDLIVTAHGVKTVISIDNSKPVFIGGIEKTVWRIRTETGFYRECDVKTIRKPRKGSKEARDIVAMLAHSYWKSLKALSKGWIDGVEEEKHREAMEDWWKRRKNKDEFIIRSSVFFEYQKAKSMLK